MRFAILFIGDISVFLGRRSANIFLAARKTRTGGQERVKKSEAKRRGEDPACDFFRCSLTAAVFFFPPPLGGGGVSWLTHFPLRHCTQAPLLPAAVPGLKGLTYKEKRRVYHSLLRRGNLTGWRWMKGGYTHAQAATLHTHRLFPFFSFLFPHPWKLEIPPAELCLLAMIRGGEGFVKGVKREARAARKGCGKNE